MAKMLSLRLRRALTSLSPTLHCSLTPTPAISAPLSTAMHSSEPAAKSAWHPGKLLPSRNFRSSATLMLSARSSRGGNFVDDDKTDPDMVLFEGCDYNHWLITMDFPKDPKPTPEEMVRTYEETCAKGLNISLEEAKKRMYACSTTTYQGFQAVMTEAESEQFRGLPGVVFILPDSYIDPQNKEYGGDKYENGVITHRPPPIQYSPRGRRHNNRNFDQPRYDRQGGGSNPLWNRQGSQYNHPGTPQSNYGAPQNYAPHQHGHPTREGERGNSMPLNDRVQYYSPGGSDIPQRRDAMPPYQGNYGHQVQNNYYGQGPGGNRVNYAPPGQSNPMGGNGNFVPTPGGPYGQDAYGVQGSGTNYGQGTYSNMQGNTAPGESQWSKQDDQGNTRGDHRGYSPMEQRGAEQMRRN